MIGEVFRRLDWARRRLLGRTDPIILMYHRVAHAPVDPWKLAVEPGNFDEQMAVLAETRHPVPLDWLANELREGRRPQRAVAVTFDDGYLDVLENARPSLARHNVPATVFIVSGMVGADRGYWWDQLAELVFGASHLPDLLPYTSPEIEAARIKGDRWGLHLGLWRVVRVLHLEDRYAAVAALGRAFGTDLIATPPVMSEAQLHQLTEGGLVTLGVHTVTHASLPSLSSEGQRAEIGECKAMLERVMGEPNRRLAYPFGDFDDRSLSIADELGFDYAVSVNPGPAIRWRQRFRLPRHDVKNWSGGQFRRRLAWFG